MTKIITGMAMAMMFCVAAASQVSNVGPTPAEVSQELRALERRWVAALTSGDSKTLSEILDDNYTDTSEEGIVTDKNGVLAALKSGDLAISSIAMSGMKVHLYVYGAVVTGRAIQAGTYKGQKMAGLVVF